MSQGRLEGDAVRCMYHGIKFDCTGKCVQIPGQDMIPTKMRLRTYPVHQVGHLVWIWMGEPALADPSQILSLPSQYDDLDERVKIALRVTDAFITRPDTLEEYVSHQARSTFTPEPLVELCRDITKWSTQKIYVAQSVQPQE